MLQVCDDAWHHYAISVNFPDVTLHVDGEKWVPTTANSTSGAHIDNPEVIDDWPLHPASDIKTKVTIGACWQGNTNKSNQSKLPEMAGGEFRKAASRLSICTGKPIVVHGKRILSGGTRLTTPLQKLNGDESTTLLRNKRAN